MPCLCLIGIFGYLGYLYNKIYNSNRTSEEIIKNNKIIYILELVGFIINLLDFFLISNEKLAPELLYSYYTQHKILIKIIYFFGGLVLIGIFSFLLFIKFNIRNNNAQFNKVQLK